jgi:hypothetical protein
MVDVLRTLDGMRGAILPSSTRKIQEVGLGPRGRAAAGGRARVCPAMTAFGAARGRGGCGGAQVPGGLQHGGGVACPRGHMTVREGRWIILPASAPNAGQPRQHPTGTAHHQPPCTNQHTVSHQALTAAPRQRPPPGSARCFLTPTWTPTSWCRTWRWVPAGFRLTQSTRTQQGCTLAPKGPQIEGQGPFGPSPAFFLAFDGRWHVGRRLASVCPQLTALTRSSTAFDRAFDHPRRRPASPSRRAASPPRCSPTRSSQCAQRTRRPSCCRRQVGRGLGLLLAGRACYWGAWRRGLVLQRRSERASRGMRESGCFSSPLPE